MKNKKRIIRLNCMAYSAKSFDLDPDMSEAVVLYDIKRKPYINVKVSHMHDISVFPGWVESYSIVEESTDTVISTFTLKTAEDCQNFAKRLSDTRIANWMLNLE